MREKIPLLVIGGPTASGKTALAVELAKRYGGEIVSADSMQLYRRMDIATAKPTLEEMGSIKHHLLSILDPGESFSVAQYVSMAHERIAQIHDRGALPILAGGTGLYISSVIDNIQFSPVQGSEQVRMELFEIANREGVDKLYAMLLAADPRAAASIHPHNVGRVVRALEVYRVSDITLSEMVERSRAVPSPYQTGIIILNFIDRQKLYNRINRRVDLMMQQGLLEEARALRKENLSKTALQAIGYKELDAYFDGNQTLEEAIEKIKMETRRYAKRQLTWFKRISGGQMLYLDEYTTLPQIADAAAALLQNSGFLDKLCSSGADGYERQQEKSE